MSDKSEKGKQSFGLTPVGIPQIENPNCSVSTTGKADQPAGGDESCELVPIEDESKVVIPVVDEFDLVEIKDQILDHYRYVKASERKAVKSNGKIEKEREQVAAARKSEAIEAWKAGRLLLQVQENMQEGFDRWRKGLSRDGFRDSTSSRYLRLAKEIPDLETLEVLLNDYPSLNRLYVRIGIKKNQNAQNPTKKAIKRFELVVSELNQLDPDHDELNQDEMDRLLRSYTEMGKFVTRMCPGRASVTVFRNGDQ